VIHPIDPTPERACPARGAMAALDDARRAWGRSFALTAWHNENLRAVRDAVGTLWALIDRGALRTE
jgi:hypothetical protein